MVARMNRLHCLVWVVFFCWPTAFLSAHDSPLHTIEELNKNGDGLSPQQLHQRAVAYRASGQLDLAVADLQSAISRSPQEIGYRLELARTLVSAHKNEDAIRASNHALMLARTPEQRASIYMLQAEVYQAEGEYKKSLMLTERAFKERPAGELEWYLMRSQNQKKLHLNAQRVRDLEAGMTANVSAVLKSHWIDALLENEQFQRALKESDKELVDRRWKSSYRIKRARALIGLKRRAEAESELAAAIAEILPRLNPESLDLLLVSDIGQAHALLFHKKRAESCLKLLKLHRAPNWLIQDLAAQIETSFPSKQNDR